MTEFVANPQLSLSEALDASTSRIFDFTGRSRRSEFWWMKGIVIASSIFLTPFVGCILDLLTVPIAFRRLHDIGRSGWWYGVLFILKALFFVSLIVDFVLAMSYGDSMEGYAEELVAGTMAKYCLWLVVIAAYEVLLLVFFCTDSEREWNKYGESPKYKNASE